MQRGWEGGEKACLKSALALPCPTWCIAGPDPQHQVGSSKALPCPLPGLKGSRPLPLLRGVGGGAPMEGPSGEPYHLPTAKSSSH